MAPLRLLLAAALACAGCTTPVQVLQLPEIRDCEVARLGAQGDACALPEPCLWTEPSGGTGCCAHRATCTNGRLLVETSCSADCELCGHDLDCAFGEEFCAPGPEHAECVPCLPAGPCPPCPGGWVPLQRNGCPSCECAPPKQCEIFEPASCPSPDRCYIGQRCAEGCSGIDCCVNVCSGGDCVPIVWEGCPVACSATPGCGSCALEGCTCMPGGQWACRERCIPPGSVRPCQIPPDLGIIVIIP